MLEGIKAKKISFWIKSLIFLSVALVLYYVLSHNEKLDEIYLSEIKKGWEGHSGLLILAVLLIPVNWSLEAFKWKRLIGKLEQVTFKRALEGVITGVAMGFVTPHSIGDYPARILCLTSPERLKGIGAVFLSRISQFYITLYFGTAALMFYVYKAIQQTELNYTLVIWFTVLNNILFFLIFIYHRRILSYFGKRHFFKKSMLYFEIILSYSFREINIVLLLSLLRYIVFCIQFVLILVCFNIELSPWLMFVGVMFIFFAKSVIPTFLDLGVRETAAVIFFSEFIKNQQNIIFASLTLWLLNLVFPAIVGLFLIYRMKIFNKERD